MEEIIPLISHGCKLVRELESNLPNLANQPNILWQSCDQIIRVFSNTRDHINEQLLISRGGDQVVENIGGEMQQQQQQQWLRYSPSTDLVLHPQRLLELQQEAGLLEGIVVPNLGGGDLLMERWRRSGGDEVVQPMDVANAGSGSSSSQRSTRRRKDDGDTWTERVAAPRMGNIEIPPEDGFTWRKYGQKEILGTRFLRGYYRCTHQKLYQCPAKKQVQRLDHDPFTFEVKYRGHHTCTMSSTAPSISVPLAPPVLTTQQATPTPSSQLQPPSDSVPIGHWLSMDIRPPTGESAGTSTSAFGDVQRYRNFSLSGSSSDVVGSEGAGPSTVRFGRDPDQYYHPVAEFADVMFNSASSTNSNMDLIFSAAMDDKWDTGTGDRKQN